MTARPLSFEDDGGQRFEAVLDEHGLGELEGALAHLQHDQAGVRLHGIQALSPLLRPPGPLGRSAEALLGAPGTPVRAVLFDKTALMNWALGWHQDRTIVGAERREVEGYGPWSIKHGLHHVEPPVEVLADMLTLRVHLDPVSDENAPLLVSPGSHRLGRIAVERVPEVVQARGVRACLARRGDVWAYRTLILHASEAAKMPMRRRVLQVDYSAGSCRAYWTGLAFERSPRRAADRAPPRLGPRAQSAYLPTHG